MDILILSPHFDDAVGSLGGLMQRLVARGRVPTVVTATGGLPADRDSSAYVKRRRHEDDQACRVIGCKNAYLSILDAVYRTGAAGEPLYRTVFAPIHPDDDVVAQLVRQLRLLPRLDAVTLYAPAGIGGHLDHLACRNASRLLKCEVKKLIWYREFFYHREYPDDPPGLAKTKVITLTPHEMQTKINAFAEYRTQLQGLYGDVAAMKRCFIAAEGEEVLYGAGREKAGGTGQ
jgi:LmbE family N-acetylglucosaminyl deacetylase